MTAEFEPSPLQGLRRDRMAACFLESMPSASEIDRARARFLRGRVQRRKLGTRALLITVVQGMVLGLASAAAAAFVADRVNHRAPAAPPAAETAAPAASARREHARPQRVEPPKAAALAPAAAPPRAAFEDLRRAPAPGGKPATPGAHSPTPRFERQAPRAPQTEDAPPRLPAAGAGNGAQSTAFPAPIGPWERVANALEAGDWRSADTALNDLTASGDTHARDAAALARAQLWISQGRGSEAKSTLLQLAQHGKTPLIRRRAAALLQGL